jgi:hypothetical protein
MKVPILITRMSLRKIKINSEVVRDQEEML